MQAVDQKVLVVEASATVGLDVHLQKASWANPEEEVQSTQVGGPFPAYPGGVPSVSWVFGLDLVLVVDLPCPPCQACRVSVAIVHH